MKRLLIILFTVVLFLGSQSTEAQPYGPKEYQARYQKVMERTQWWRDARFGMFIHFGPYAVPAKGEWFQSAARMTSKDYKKYTDAFYPEDFDAKAIARLARNAGMKYVVMTAKHHDGFCMFDSKYTDYKITTNMPDRDIFREYVEAFRAEGIKVGVYYSLVDWHHPDYPNVGNHPMRDSVEWGESRTFNWDNYVQYLYNQVEELMTNYGRIDVAWFDFSFGEYIGEKWGATKLVEMVRKNQPGIIIDSRLSGVHDKLPTYGDFDTPELGIPDEPLIDEYGNPLPWETCMTLNNDWGYDASDHEWKSSQDIVHALVECVSKDGNFLLNIGPDGKGRVPDESIKILTEVGKWMQRNSESIYGCGKAEIGKPEWGRFTQKGKTIYAHWLYPHMGMINIKGYTHKIERVTLLNDGSAAATALTYWGNKKDGNFFINLRSPIYLTYKRPDIVDTVLKIELK